MLLKLFQVIIVGDNRVGKTRLIFRVRSGEYLVPDAKFNDPFHVALKTIYERHEYVTGMILDTTSYQKFNLPPIFYKKTMVVIFAYDITNRSSFENIEKWIENAKANIEHTCFLVLVGTKVDCLASKRQVKFSEGLEFAEKHDMKLFYETSSKTGENVEIMVYNVVKLIRDNIEEIPIEIPKHVEENQTNYTCKIL